VLFRYEKNTQKKKIKINLKEPNALNMLILVLEEQDKIEEAKNLSVLV